jgi:hypothetical protein
MSDAKRFRATTDPFRYSFQVFPSINCQLAQLRALGAGPITREQGHCSCQAQMFEVEVNAMSNVDTRQVGRDSLFLLAQVRVGEQKNPVRVKVRNLSAGGMMAEGDVDVMRGACVEIELRNLGWVKGSVAWVQGNRFGIAFVDEIDPKLARAPVVGSTLRYDAEGRLLSADELERGFRKI